MARAVARTAPRGTASADYALEYDLGTVSANTTMSDECDILGYVSRVYIHVVNGASNSVVYTIEGSHTGVGATTAEWFTIACRRHAGLGFATTATTTTAAVQECLFLSGPDTPRYVRVNVATANTNGTVFRLLAER